MVNDAESIYKKTFLRFKNVFFLKDREYNIYSIIYNI